MLRKSIDAFKNILRHRKPELICAILCGAATLALVDILIERHFYVVSSNALVQTYVISLSSQVPGQIERVLVHENQPVRKGQLLCLLDERPYRHDYDAAQGQVEAIEPQLKAAQVDLRRMELLLRTHAVDRATRDHAFADATSLEQQLKAAQARAADAKTSLLRTEIRAPGDGIIAFRSARVGTYATAGFPLFGFIPDEDRWVTAKIKETDLSGVHIGDPVDVRLDAFPGHKFHGSLESFPPASETPFAAIPDDFSAGNFTKYVQWVPVRVHLELDPDERRRIPIGVTSEIRMKRGQS
jgi:membrane fusion protein (multidrug efflux system)